MRIVSDGWDLKITHQSDRFFIVEKGDCFFITGVSGQIDIQETGTLIRKNRTQGHGIGRKEAPPFTIAVIPG